MSEEIELYITDLDTIPTIKELEEKERLNPAPAPATYLISENISTSVEKVNLALNRYNKVYGETVFYCEGKLVLIENEYGDCVIKNIDKGKLRWLLSKAGEWKDFEKMEVCKIPYELLESALSAPASALNKIRQLKGLNSGILLKTNGEVVSKKGYDRDTQLYFTKDSEVAEIPKNPSDEDISDAKRIIDELINEFVFEKRVDYENAVLALATLVFRLSLDGPTPIYAVDKNSTRAGGTLLCQTLGAAALGYIPNPLSSTKRADEIDKQIRSAVKDSMAYAIIDNVVPKTEWTPEVLLSLSSGTGTIVSRNMGTYDTFTGGGKTMFAVNGVNLRISADVCGRVFKTRLMSPKAWQSVRYKRTKAELFNLAVKQNPNVIWAIGVFLMNWIAKGSPSPKVCDGNLSEYPVWYNLCVGILDCAGYSNLLTNQKELQTDENDADVLGKEFIECLVKQFGSNEFSPKAILKVLVSEGEARKNGSFEGLLDFAPDDIVKSAVSGTLTTQKVGIWMKEYVGGKFSGCEWYLNRIRTFNGTQYVILPVEVQSAL